MTSYEEQLIGEIRLGAGQFASLYFDFVNSLYCAFGRDKAIALTTKLLFDRACARAAAMIQKAEKTGLARSPENITKTSDVAYSGWDQSLGADHCPYGVVWREKIADHPWFREFAALYCDVTDTTIGEVFTGTHSHRLYKNVVLGDETCERDYFLSDSVKNGIYTYGLYTYSL